MKSRIPRFQPRTIGDVHRWFAEMDAAGLLYHPDEPAETIVLITSDQRMFTDEESVALNRIVGGMFKRFGDRVYEVGAIFFMHRVHGVWS